ncbi:MAG TPA: sigma-70 family RNA polymerase sigma factor [Planctomycetota bacterium]|nr:sigma-70 family RNA polymerase sigma factor [Planctomycetota bacterium]
MAVDRDPERDVLPCVGGDAAACESIAQAFAAFVRTVVREVFARHGARDGIDDAAQDVFVRLFQDGRRLLRTFDPRRARLATWLAVVARSTALNALRRRPRGERVEAAEPVAAPVRSGALDLPPRVLTARQALILRLAFEDGLDPEEIGRFLGIDAQTVRSTKHKAVERLRAHARDTS